MRLRRRWEQTRGHVVVLLWTHYWFQLEWARKELELIPDLSESTKELIKPIDNKFPIQRVEADSYYVDRLAGNYVYGQVMGYYPNRFTPLSSHLKYTELPYLTQLPRVEKIAYTKCDY